MLGSPLYGTTVDDVAHLRQIVDGLRHLPRMPTTRIYFDVNEPANYYKAPVGQLRPVSYLMGELLDSADEIRITTSAYNARVKSYVAAFKDQIDLWEIGNEVNGSWTGRYPTVEAKLTTAYDEVAAAHQRTALTLYYNVGCGDGPAELDPIAFSRAYVPSTVRNGLNFVLLSYYEDNCNGIRPSAGTWKAYFTRLHTLYPHALLGFGEIGMNKPVTAPTLAKAESLLRYYYGLGIKLPYYVGGYFWWYFYEDCLPYLGKPLWGTLRAGFQSEASRLGLARQAGRADEGVAQRLDPRHDLLQAAHRSAGLAGRRVAAAAGAGLRSHRDRRRAQRSLVRLIPRAGSVWRSPAYSRRPAVPRVRPRRWLLSERGCGAYSQFLSFR